MERPSYQEALERLALMRRLAAYDPHVAGTPPLGLALPSSDIDVLCHASDATRFVEDVSAAFGAEEEFRVGRWSGGERAIIATFSAHGWPIEIFGHPTPVAEQAGWRHFLVERRLLALGGKAFHAAVMAERKRGLKTEPAFAAALKLGGDPYTALLALEQRSEEEQKALLKEAGFALSRA